MIFKCGRGYTLEGIFISTKEKVEKLIESEINVYFGEVLGKHSEVYGNVEADEIKLISEDVNVVEIFENNNLSNGYDPFEYTSTNFEIDNLDLDDMLVDEIVSLLIEMDKK